MVKVRSTGDGEVPNRDYVAEELFLLTTWINAREIYSGIVLSYVPLRRSC